MVYPHTYPNSIVTIAAHPAVPADSIVLNDVQRHTLGASPHDVVQWSLYLDEDPPLVCVECEVRPRARPSDMEEEEEQAPELVVLDAAELAAALGRHLFQARIPPTPKSHFRVQRPYTQMHVYHIGIGHMHKMNLKAHVFTRPPSLSTTAC